jgi:hypothetical protein
MRKLFIISAFLAFCTTHTFSQLNEPHAIYHNWQNASSTESDYYDNPLFTNINLTNNSAPQNEPSIRISRTNPNNIVAAWRDFRLGYIAPNIVRRIGYTYSSNGGVTWAPSQLLPDPNPGHTSQSDPVVISDNQGYFYISSTSRKQESFPENRDMLLYRSTNNGQTFSLYSVAVPGTGGSGEDKEWIFCDLVQGSPTFNNIFISWTSFGNISTGIKFRRSSNGGLNWTSTVDVADNLSGQGSMSAVGTNGYVYIVWSSSGIKFDKSTNSGANFGTDYSLSTVSSTNGFPFICCDYSNHSTRGNVYVVWDDRRGGNSDVWFQRSTNAGSSWLSSPVRVNDVTTNDQYWPAIQCDTNGYLYVIYYDKRISSTQINSYIAYSTNAGDSWVNFRLSDSSFAGSQPNSDVRFGDYIQVDVYRNKVIGVWTDDRLGNPNQEIYSAVLSNLVSSGNISTIVPKEFKLYQNYPNPFNPSTRIKLDVPSVAGKQFVSVQLKIYDVLGREIKTLADRDVKPGSYEFDWNASEVSGGVYFYKLFAEGFTDTKKMVLVK